MKKDYIFAPALTLVSLALSLLSYTGMTAHIIISIVGALILVAYTVVTKKYWKIPALEIGTRASYGIALITGIIVYKVHGIMALGIIHKVSALLFIIGILAIILTNTERSRKADK